ncbi:hypothetical protein GCM10011512_28370 [Tersicoccus solisilvae]|uniref:Glycosyltransferase 2-like domain-containing protein n=1 Tax=Tersicoccus solisilvae TaxID=1882339 RepID=A0ABQ1PMH5_9MICC|nr:glycosyltransferase family 2 protein [Tersicoccus solisilvae]GGC99812.1 hypothetical protein GCM10011512_28370 [Tersicoccus solisilvae]
MTDVGTGERSAPRLAVVVVNYGSSALLDRNLRVVADQCPDAVVVVVDNPTTQRERDAVRGLVDRQGWVGVYPETNLGFGSGMNVGVAAARAAGATEFLLLNPDATIRGADVELLRAAVHRRPMLLVSPLVRRPDGTTWFAGSDLYLRSGLMRSRRRRRTDRGPVREWLSGACLLIGASLWDAVGGFRDDYFLYWEDVDLSHRVVAAGGALAVVEAAEALHDEGGTHRDDGQVGKSATYYYWNALNRLRYATDHLSPGARLRWLALAPWAARDLLLQGGRRQLLRPRTPVSAVVRGTVAGAALVLRSLVPSRPARGVAGPGAAAPAAGAAEAPVTEPVD